MSITVLFFIRYLKKKCLGAYHQKNIIDYNFINMSQENGINVNEFGFIQSKKRFCCAIGLCRYIVNVYKLISSDNDIHLVKFNTMQIIGKT